MFYISYNYVMHYILGNEENPELVTQNQNLTGFEKQE